MFGRKTYRSFTEKVPPPSRFFYAVHNIGPTLEAQNLGAPDARTSLIILIDKNLKQA